jgi:CheY-like chemotaxis protein
MSASRILVVDDDLDHAESLAEILEMEGHEVTIAGSGEQLLSDNGYRALVANTGSEAIERAASEPVDVLVLDLRLPVLHGLDVYMELKRRRRELPTILVTAYRPEEAKSIDTPRSMSVAGCLFKPFEPAELLSVIDEVKTEKCR